MNFFVEHVFAASGDADAFLTRLDNQIISPFILLLFALAIFWFILGMVKYIRNAESPDKREEGYQHMLWSVIGIFIMISVKGIINLVLNTLYK